MLAGRFGPPPTPHGPLPPLMLRIEHLSKTYPNGIRAVDDVSLSIPPGMFGLLGPNGAGKSTLMRILATLQEADAGTATFGDIDVLRDKEAVRRTLEIGRAHV